MVYVAKWNMFRHNSLKVFDLKAVNTVCYIVLCIMSERSIDKMCSMLALSI